MGESMLGVVLLCLMVNTGTDVAAEPAPDYTMTATCDNKMRVYFDGVLQPAPLRELNDWTKTSGFNVPGGTQVVGIECLDVGVVGGILASFSNGVVTDNGWYCSAQFCNGWSLPGFDATSSAGWNPATEIGNNGVSPWRTRPGISGHAKWIWTPNWHGGDKKVYCRKVVERTCNCDAPEHTMTATCDNQMKVYFDGDLQPAPLRELNDWTKTSGFNVPGGTEVVGIECLDLGVVGGILASFSNGEVTDNGWHCSAQFCNGWSLPGFDATSSAGWNRATEIGNNGVSPWWRRPGISGHAKWIWTPNWHGGDKKVYCRKVVERTSSSS